MQTNHKKYSFVVFPFLKTAADVKIGDLTFRSTDNTDGLPSDQAACVNEIAGMLFLRDNFRIQSASYAVVPFIDIDHPSRDVEHLMNLQAFVAYRYASPRHEFGDIFLSSEHASMAIFTPSKVSIYLARPDFHVDALQPTPDVVPDQHGEVEGYVGLYNFRHPFWVAKGSRLYGPMPHLTLNRSQDLSHDLDHRSMARTDYRLLAKLLCKPPTETSSCIFTALKWFNAANSDASDDAATIVNLAIAFEALLKLPDERKTERFIDTIALLLGRIPRLDIWARQFYNARSQVVHEGHVHQLRFIATDSPKASDGPLYQSFISYGRRVFQLCLGTLLAGVELAENAGLAETLVTNEERFQKICEVFANKTLPTDERLGRVAPIISVAEQYRYVQEDNLQIKTMLSAVRYAAEVLLESDEAISQELKEHLERLTTAKRTKDYLEKLEALQALNTVLENESVPAELSAKRVVRDLVKLVWDHVFMHYFWLKKRSAGKDQGASS